MSSGSYSGIDLNSMHTLGLPTLLILPFCTSHDVCMFHADCPQQALELMGGGSQLSLRLVETLGVT